MWYCDAYVATTLEKKKYIEAHGRFIKESPGREEAKRQPKWRQEEGSQQLFNFVLFLERPGVLVGVGSLLRVAVRQNRCGLTSWSLLAPAE